MQLKKLINSSIIIIPVRMEVLDFQENFGKNQKRDNGWSYL